MNSMRYSSIAILMGLCTLHAGAKDTAVSFERKVSNIEYAKGPLSTQAPYQLKEASETDAAWYGAIMRRHPGEAFYETKHYVPFRIAYSAGVPEKAWLDGNCDGRIEVEERVRLWAYPAIAGARAFLADFTKTCAPHSILRSMVRIVLEPRRPAPRW